MPTFQNDGLYCFDLIVILYKIIPRRKCKKMSRKSFLFFALVFVFALVLARPVSARQIVGGGGTSDEVTLTQLSVNRAGLNIVFAGGIKTDTEGLEYLFARWPIDDMSLF